jgi:LuxR family quorum-sensing system transcriptional regulator SolR
MDAWQEEKIHSLSDAKTEDEFFSVLAKIGNELGFEYCAYGMQLPLPVSNPKLVMLNNYPDKWRERYQKENYLLVDPTVAHGMNSMMPLIWSDNVFANSRPFWEDARDHGLRVGWARSCHDGKGVGGLLTLARSHESISVQELGHSNHKMSWLAQAAHETLAQILTSKFLPEVEANLSLREIEVLRWTAEGKTSSEVGDIMAISKRTVNFHVSNSLQKLNASNKIAAVIKAAKLGLL